MWPRSLNQHAGVIYRRRAALMRRAPSLNPPEIYFWQLCTCRKMCRHINSHRLMYDTYFLQLWLAVCLLLVYRRVWEKQQHCAGCHLTSRYFSPHNWSNWSSEKEKPRRKIWFHSFSEVFCNHSKIGILLILRLITWCYLKRGCTRY